MHFDFTITLGQVAIALPLIGGFLAYYRPFVQRQWEHDLMWNEFAERKGLTSHEQVAPRFRSKSAGAD